MSSSAEYNQTGPTVWLLVQGKVLLYTSYFGTTLNVLCLINFISSSTGSFVGSVAAWDASDTEIDHMSSIFLHT